MVEKNDRKKLIDFFRSKKKILEKKSDGQYAVTFYLLGFGELFPTPDNTDGFLRVCEHSILHT